MSSAAPRIATSVEHSSPCVREVAAVINSIVAQSLVHAAFELGQYLIDAFNGGEVAGARASLAGNRRFRSLETCEELRVPFRSLLTSVAVVEQAAALPEHVRERLSLSHHKLLLGVKDEATKRRLAVASVDQSLSKRQLQALVRDAKPAIRGQRGRPRIPTFLKAVRQLGKLADRACESPDLRSPSGTTPAPGPAANELAAAIARLLGELDALEHRIQQSITEEPDPDSRA